MRKSLLCLLFCLQFACSQPTNHNPRNIDVDIPPKQGKARIVVVFVHGIMGNAASTFTAAGATQSWPQLLADDTSIGVPIYVKSIAYVSEPLRRASNIHEIATRLQTRLMDKGVFENFDQVVFVTHSMGGLITKHMLLQINRDSPIDYAKVAGVFFLATPAGGSNLADLAKWLSSNPQFKDMASEDFNTFLQAEEDDWAAMLRRRPPSDPYPRVFCVYEKLPIGPVVVVPRSRTQTGCDERPVAYDRNHFDIVKPTSTSDEVYEYVSARLKRITMHDYTPLTLSITLLTTSGAKIPDDVVLKSGDQYVIEVSATKPAWLYVFAEDSSGKTERYFPGKGTGTQLKVLNKLRIPVEPDRFFTLDTTKGFEHLHVLASGKSRDDLDNLGQEVAAAPAAKASSVLRKALQTRGATVEPRHLTVSPTIPRRFQVSNLGADAYATLTFLHN